MEITVSVPIRVGAKPHTGPVLPVIAGKPVAGGFQLRNESDEKSFRELLYAAIAFLMFAGFGLTILFYSKDEGCAKTAMALFAIVSIVVTVGSMIRIMMQRAWDLRRFGAADLLVHPWPIRLGDDVTFKFFRAKRQRTAIERVEAFVECKESYLIDNDETREWRSHTRRSIEVASVPEPDMRKPLRFEWHATIPGDEPGSASMTNSAILWGLLVRLHGKGDQTADTWFHLLVLPEVRE